MVYARGLIVVDEYGAGRVAERYVGGRVPELEELPLGAGCP